MSKIKQAPNRPRLWSMQGMGLLLCGLASAWLGMQESFAQPSGAQPANETIPDKVGAARPPSKSGQVIKLPGKPDTEAVQARGFRQGSVHFIGNATVVIEYAGIRILTDPNFLHKGQHVHLGYGLKAQRLTDPALSIAELPPIDFILLSHAHGDHFDQVAQQELDKSLPVVTTPGAAAELAKLGFHNSFPLEAWESLMLTKGEASVRIGAMPARHGPPVVASTLPETMGSMLEFMRPDGQVAYRMYISGDTLIHDEIREIPKRFPDIDLALLHLGGTEILDTVMVTMDAEQGVEMMRIVAPEHAIPIHYNDYDVFKSPIEDFQRQIREAGMQSRVTVLRHGERFVFQESRHVPTGGGTLRQE